MSQRPNPFEIDLEKNAANHVPMSPLTFIARAAAVYPQRAAVVHGHDQLTWAESYDRCRRLASARSAGAASGAATPWPSWPRISCTFRRISACP
jgi:fatty-acyl-CoA synthase